MQLSSYVNTCEHYLLATILLTFIAFSSIMPAMKHVDARNFTFRLPKEVYAVLSAEAKARGITLARLTRLSIAAYLEGSRKGLAQ